jgi:hypothetical protein
MPSAERRIHSRFPFTSRLVVRPRLPGATAVAPGQVTQAIAIDVSVGGLGFRSQARLTIGEHIRVALRDTEPYSMDTDGLGVESPVAPKPNELSFEIEAVVRHVSREGGDYVIGAERHGSA